MDTIELYDESGNKETFRIIDTFGMDDEDYVAMISTNEVNSLTYIMKIEYEESGEVIFRTVDDEEEFQDAIDIYEQLKKEKLQ
jgi:uncharacterized protein YrzB (UPF0473 family)